MDAGLIFALVWSVLALGWGGFLLAKRNELAGAAAGQQDPKALGTRRRWALSATVVGWIGVVFLLIGVVTLVLLVVGATR